ncbi:MAG TPA: thiamine pyrophosphate-binding protein, partial [Saprospiraceae bacterium]|nr:thiamine pyrophosphate-binding protein [Saprospiraceae bacterium]
MELTNKEGVRLIVNALAELGLRHVVICPGSRNAPFVISFNRHAAFKCYSIRDERSAGFFALGLAKETHLPVAILCTSGSATVNFAPAITEAYYQRIPLVVLTTDRPEIWVDQGDGQTIRQQGIYNNYIRKSYVLKGDAEKAD